MAARIFEAGGRADAGKGLVAAQPDGFDFGKVGTLNGKAHHALGIGFPHVNREEHVMRAADRADADETGNHFAHAALPELAYVLVYCAVQRPTIAAKNSRLDFLQMLYCACIFRLSPT